MKKPIINPGIIKRLKSIFAIVQDGDVATRNIASGKYVLWKNVPCHASSAITTGDTLAIGTNLTADNDGFINALHDGLSAFSGKAIANNLTTETAGYVLDARQGKALNDSCGNIIAEPGTYTIEGVFTGFNTGSGNYIDFFVPVYFAKSLTVTSARFVTSASIFFGTTRMNLSLPVSLTISKVMKNGLLLEMNYSSTQTQNVQATISAIMQLVFE